MNGKTTGRDALSYAITKGTELTGSSSGILKGIWYYVTARDSSASVLPEKVAVGRAFLCSLAVVALGAGDSVIPLTLSLLGFARDKQLDASKTVQDSTTDLDDESDSLSDGLVSKTGSINGFDVVDSPTSILKAQFEHTIIATAGAEGTADVITATEKSTPKQLILIDWDGRAPVEGEDIIVDIMPVIFTQMSKGASYGGVKTLNFNYTCVASDEDGCKPTHFEGPYRAPVASA